MNQVYQIKITIPENKIWRRAQILDSYTFWDLHIIVCDMMEWWGSLLHYFRVESKDEIQYIESFLDLKNSNSEVKISWNTKVSEYILNKKSKISYIYHGLHEFICEITLEKVLKQIKNKEYPSYMAGNNIVPYDIEHYLCGYPQSMYEDVFDIEKITFTGTQKALILHKSFLIDSIYGNLYHTDFF
jgi:hypothetical protein